MDNINMEKLSNKLNTMPQALPILTAFASRQRSHKYTALSRVMRVLNQSGAKVTYQQMEEFFNVLADHGIGSYDRVRGRIKGFVWAYSMQSVAEVLLGPDKAAQLKRQVEPRTRLTDFRKRLRTSTSEVKVPAVAPVDTRKIAENVNRRTHTITARRGNLEIVIPLDVNNEEVEAINNIISLLKT